MNIKASMRLALSRLFSVPKARLGWIFIIVGTFAWFLFGRNADWKSINFYRAELRQSNGIVTSVSETGFTSGSEMSPNNIYEVRFTFDGPDKHEKSGTSWTDHTPPKRGAKIQVEYNSSNPDIARIKNMRSGLLPLWASATLAFPFFGIYCLVIAIFIGHDSDGE